MRKLRVILQRLRAFRLKKKCFFLSNLKRRPRSSSRDSSVRSKRAQSMASSSKNEKFGPQSAFLKKKQQSRGGPSGLDLLACNPCAGNTAGMVVENYKFQIQGPKRLPKPQNENWENEKSWNIVTQVGDEFVTKKVILKKKSKSKSKTEVAASNVQAAAAFCEDDPFEGSCSSSRYRLSTSSSIADAPGSENLLYSWDKELSFASGDDRYLDEDRHSCEILDRLEASSKDVFIDPPCCKACTFSDAQLLGGSFSSFEHYIRSVQSAGDKHFPSPDSASIEDARETVADFPPSEWSSDEAEVSSEVPQLESKGNVPDCDATIPAPCTRIEKKEQVGRGCGGVAVEKVSLDPYKDYRDSMLEMSIANGLKQGSDFEELLQCYLSLNPPEFHNIIVEVFTDLFWQRLV